MSATTTLNVEGAEVTVETSALFRAWFEKHLQSQISKLPVPTPRQGEKHLCTITTADGRVCHTFLLPDRAKFDWKTGMQWAKNLGGDLMDRAEQAVAFRDMPDEFDKEAHWSNTQHAGYSNYAWYQNFKYGDQLYSFMDNALSVRAVRREFSDSVI
ncbi:MAG: hypothetical protein WC742_12450 [Gallionellaceae bacterium]|jgi:hypothetical protein